MDWTKSKSIGMLRAMVDPHPPDSLSRLPAGLFGAALGMTGIALAWTKAADLDYVDPTIGFLTTLVAAFVFCAAASALGAKALLRPTAFFADMRDPNRFALYGAGAMSLMGIGGLVAGKSPLIATILWQTGAGFDGLVCIIFCARLLTGRWQFSAAGPIWMIAAVGPISAPASGIPLGQDLAATMLFGAGLLGFALVLPPILVRIAFHDRPPEGAGLIVLLTPPALGTVNLASLNGGADHVAYACFGAGCIVFFALFGLGRRIMGAPPSLAFWAAVFPISNFAIAADLVGTAADAPALVWGGLVLTGAVSMGALGILVWMAAVAIRGGFLADGRPAQRQAHGATKNGDHGLAS
jgi:tellurite resistance protein